MKETMKNVRPEQLQKALMEHAMVATEMWQAFETVGTETPEFKELRIKYEQSVGKMLELQGPKAPCRNVDVDLWGRYIEMFREIMEIDPSPMASYESVKEWMRVRLH